MRVAGSAGLGQGASLRAANLSLTRNSDESDSGLLVRRLAECDTAAEVVNVTVACSAVSGRGEAGTAGRSPNYS